MIETNKPPRLWRSSSQTDRKEDRKHSACNRAARSPCPVSRIPALAATEQCKGKEKKLVYSWFYWFGTWKRARAVQWSKLLQLAEKRRAILLRAIRVRAKSLGFGIS
jgi:hypothetical protein